LRQPPDFAVFSVTHKIFGGKALFALAGIAGHP
jgi:hypothetical protein